MKHESNLHSQPTPLDPERLASLGPDRDPTGIARLLRNGRAVEQTTEPVLGAVKSRIRETVRRRSAWSRAPARLLRPAIAGVTLLLTGGVIGATAHRFTAALRGEEHRADPSPPAADARQRRRPAQPRRASAPPPEAVSPPAAATAPDSAVALRAAEARFSAPEGVTEYDAPSSVGGHAVPTEPSPATLPRLALPPRTAALSTDVLTSRQRVRRHGGHTASPPIEAPPEPDAAENGDHALLTDAIRRLRRDADPTAALIVLDDHERRFPASMFGPEAQALRVEALLALGRKAEAVHVLDRLLDGPLPGHDERRLLRGETLASIGRWRAAIADFNLVIADRHPAAADSRRSGLVERALWGRAVARGRAGDQAGARADLEELIRSYPHGALAAEATRTLRGAQ